MGKSGHHKAENTFRFQTFSERITNINIDVIHQIRHHDDTPEETGTYFGEALQRQMDLNLTDHFAQFRKEISDQVQTFAQLVHHEDNIVAALKKHLLVPNSMALPSLLDLVVNLARDLQTDFYRHFHEFFDILVLLLNKYTHDVEVLECTFTCFSYIFKFLWRYLLKDIQKVYGYFSSLLSKNYKEHVRNFAAESFAFLMRKAKDHSSLFDFLFSTLEAEPDKAEGLGRLMYEMMKGVKEQFHSCTTKVFPILLQKLGPAEGQSGSALPWEQVEVSMETMLLSMATHSNKDHMADIVDMMLASMSSVHQKWESTKKQAEKLLVSAMLTRMMRLLRTVIDFNNAKVLAKPDAVAKVLLKLMMGPSLPDSAGVCLLNVTESLLKTSHAKLPIEITSKLIPAVYKTAYPPAMAFDFTRGLFDLPLFEKDMLPSLLRYCDTCIGQDDTVKEQTLLLVTELVLHKCPTPANGEELEGMDTYMLDFGSGSANNFPAYVTSYVDKQMGSLDSASLAHIWACLVCLPHVRPLKDKDEHVKKLSGIISDLLKTQVTRGTDFKDSQNALGTDVMNRYFLGSQALLALILLLRNEDVFRHVPLDLVITSLCKSPCDIHLLRCADIYFTHAVNEDCQEILTLDTILQIFPALQENLSSPNSLIRLHTLRIFASFDLPLPPSDVDVLDVFKICLCAETTEASVHQYREKQRHLQKLEYTAVQNSLPAGPFNEVPLRYLIGCLFINFKLLWEPIRSLVSSHAHNMGRDAFWEIYSHQLQLAAERAEKQLQESSNHPVVTESESDEQGNMQSLFSDNCQSFGGADEPEPSYSNFRVHLWKSMHEFPEKCSGKSRLLVPLLFRFLKNEYYLADQSIAPTQNVLRQNNDLHVMDVDDLDSDLEEDVKIEESVAKKVRSRKSGGSVDKSTPAKNKGAKGKSYKKAEVENENEFSEEDDSDDDNDVDDEDGNESDIAHRTRSRDKKDENEMHINIDSDDQIVDDDDDDDDEEDENDNEEEIAHRTRSRDKNKNGVSDTDGIEVKKSERKSGIESRVRTRSQCSVASDHSESSSGRRIRTRSQRLSEIEDSDLEHENVVESHTKLKKRTETKSGKISESGNRNGGGHTPVKRMQTRSGQFMSGVDSDEDRSSSEMLDESESKEKSKNERKDKVKRLSAVNEEVENMETEEDKQTKDKEHKNKKKESVKNKSEKHTSGKSETSTPRKGVNVLKKRRKAATSSLLVQLELFAKFKDPRSMYMEPQLRQLYDDLLIHKDVEVQKTAFQCIMTYKYKSLIPYRENFNRLLDDKTFKNEIVLFSIDNDNSVICAEHRPEVLPILMRILYGKMHVKTGKGTSGKQYSKIRQSIVFRFLNGCQNQELKMFIDLVFAPFRQFVTDNPYEMTKNVWKNLDLTSVLPVKKMHGALVSMDTIIKKLGHLLDPYLTDVIQILLGAGAMCGAMLDKRDQIVPHVINPLKRIRQNTVLRMIQILEDYDKYPWRPVEIDALFEALIWPQLDKLVDEGLYHPTPLLKLLLCFTRNPSYFLFLAKHHKDNVELSPLPHVIRLLLKPEVSSHVTNCIMEMVKNLLEETEEDQEVMVIEANHMITLSSADNVKESDIGIRLLLPHVQNILVYIKTFVSTLNSKLSKKTSAISTKELDILSRVSSFVQDEEMSATLVDLLLPFLNPKFSKPKKLEENILKSIVNLLKQITDRLDFYQPISKLFASLAQRPSRLLLSDAFAVVCEREEELQPLITIVKQLNSWDHTRMDEPDYMLRLEGYRSASSLLKGMVTMDTRICLTLIYNCCFFISTVEDMSIRDSSTLCMITMVNQFRAVEYEDSVYKEVIVNNLLAEVKMGLRSKKQTVFQENVTILATMVDAFGERPSFVDLKPLRDKDIEADFFENIKHIQVYKRSRGLRRMIKYLIFNKVNFSTLTNIFLPIVTSFLVDDFYKKHTTVIDAALEAIGTICKLLPWKAYLNQLKYYLSLLAKKLERQKLLVRVIVSILDNFHFDLSKSTLNVKNTPVPKVEREPVEKELKPEDIDKDIDKENTGEIPEEENEEEAIPEINEAEESTPVESEKGKQLCSETLATKIHGTILKNVIHHLHKILVQKAQKDSEHKAVKSKYAEDEEILRVPIALAMIKLLQNLPKGALERYLPGILLKVCNFLKSRLIEIRNTSRDTLVKIQTTLGPRFFPFILSELRGSLRRGYQRHVLCYTVHQLLKNMESFVRPGDIDVCLKSLQEVLNEEIFGEVAEEKDVAGIKTKVFEARSSKSYESYEFIARYISPHSLMKLMVPIKHILDTTSSHKSARKVLDVLKKVTSGIIDNKNMTSETLLVFVHSMTVPILPLLSEEISTPKVTEEETVLGKRPESCLIIPKAAPRGGLKPKASKKTNKHVLVEFGLQLLGQCLKKQKVVSTEPTHIQMLDPLVPMLADSLFSKYILVNANCLRVLCWILRFPIPSLETHMRRIASGMFILLRNYASAGAAKGDNMELVNMLFKAVNVLVREVKYFTIDTAQLQVLLTFCEEDIHDFNRQSSAFSLLKAILSRKLERPEVHELMKKVEEMSISSEAPHVQRECRQAMLQYLLDYPLGKKLQAHLQFYVSQLTFELEYGRESALEMLATFFTNFPQNLLANNSGLFFVPMAASLANDESAKCRKLIALALKTLLGKLDYNSRTGLFNIALKWFMDEKLKHRSLAAQLTGLFVEVESAQFESRLSDILPVIEQQLEPGKYKQVESAALERDNDVMIYNTINTLLKILRECNQVIAATKWESNMNIIWEHVQSYLGYPHIWVQLAASQLFGLLFATYQPQQLVAMATTPSTQYLTVDTLAKLRSLAHDFLSQLQSELLNDELASQVIKNMIFITKCARYMPQADKPSTPEDEEHNDESHKKVLGLSVLWLVRKMTREANYEAINNNKVSIKRVHVFKWLAAIALDLGDSIDPMVLRAMLPPLQRELDDQSMSQDQSLRSLAQEVIEMLKKTIGVEKFTAVYASTQKVRAERKDVRKRQKAFQAVSNPELAAKRKLKKNLNKIAAKKRKVEQYKPSKKARKRKYQDFTIAE